MLRTPIVSYLKVLAAVFALGTGACLTSGSDEAASELAASGGPGGGTDPGDGQCSEILAHGCDGTTGEKLEQCKLDIENAFDECVKAEQCQKLRDDAAKDCGKDEGCLAKADQIYADCIGPAPDPTPGSK